MSIDNYMQDGEIIIWSALAALKNGKITSQTYSGILSGKVNPMEALPEEFLEHRLYKTGGLSGSYR